MDATHATASAQSTQRRTLLAYAGQPPAAEASFNDCAFCRWVQLLGPQAVRCLHCCTKGHAVMLHTQSGAGESQQQQPGCTPVPRACSCDGCLTASRQVAAVTPLLCPKNAFPLGACWPMYNACCSCCCFLCFPEPCLTRNKQLACS